MKATIKTPTGREMQIPAISIKKAINAAKGLGSKLTYYKGRMA